MRSALTRRLAGFGTTIFTEMTRLAQEHGAINLAQGFPDFDGPDFVKEAAKAAIDAGQNQYARMTGLPALNLALAEKYRHHYGLSFDPDREIVVTSGCTEAIFAAIVGICDVGDEVILFQPYYDSYRASVCMAGAIPRVVTLVPPENGRGWCFDERKLEAAFSERTRAILLNSPHNPTGKVFTRQELEWIASLCRKHNVICISDEVYEHLVYTGIHSPIATLLPELSITLSSLGKSFSLTGWKVGWACAPPALAAAVRTAHQFITFATATPFQAAAAVAVAAPDDFFVELRREYLVRRDFLSAVLSEVGLEVWEPEGTYFTCASLKGTGFDDDFTFARHLIQHGVATIPPSVFYEQPELGRGYVRFAFCKRSETLERAAERLRAWRRR